MNIVVVDSEGLLAPEQIDYAREKLLRTLERNREHVQGVTVHLGVDPLCSVQCSINVSLEGAGIVSTREASASADGALHLAIFEMESMVARRVELFDFAQ